MKGGCICAQASRSFVTASELSATRRRGHKRASNTPWPSAIARGHELAIQMLLELEHDPDRLNACLLDPQYRNAGRGRAYTNLVRLRLQDARRQGLEVEEGFTMILSDFIATSCGGSSPDSGYFDRLTESGIIERTVGVVLEPY
jgi:hypothetical protein